MCNNKIMRFVSTVSSFLHIMIIHNVDFCKNKTRFMPLIIFHFNCILLLMMKINKKQFLFHSWKISVEGRIPLITWLITTVWGVTRVNIYCVRVTWGNTYCVRVARGNHYCVRVARGNHYYVTRRNHYYVRGDQR